ncbi:MAG: hypothetical protein ACE5ID_09335, partial [Acidobacteriota bacterium]
FVSRKGKSCSDLEGVRIAVLEDGRPQRVVELRREAMPTIHLLVLDTSNSMEGRFRETLETAFRYMNQIPPGERLFWPLLTRACF